MALLAPHARPVTGARCRQVLEEFCRNTGLWGVRTGELKQTLAGHTARVRSVRYPPDGNTPAGARSDKTARLCNLVAPSSQDSTVRLRDIARGTLRHTLEGQECEVNSLACSPDGTRVASGCKDKTIKLWDPQAGSLPRMPTGPQNRPESQTFAAEGNAPASGGGPESLAWRRPVAGLQG
jgi:WD40 repeat protein